MDKLQEITETNDIRNVLWERVNGGIAAGLPVPMTVNIGAGVGHGPSFRLRCDDAEGVERWARYLGFPTPVFAEEAHETAGARWRSYYSDNDGWQGAVLAGVWCSVDEFRSDADAILAEATR